MQAAIEAANTREILQVMILKTKPKGGILATVLERQDAAEGMHCVKMVEMDWADSLSKHVNFKTIQIVRRFQTLTLQDEQILFTSYFELEGLETDQENKWREEKCIIVSDDQIEIIRSSAKTTARETRDCQEEAFKSMGFCDPLNPNVCPIHVLSGKGQRMINKMNGGGENVSP